MQWRGLREEGKGKGGDDLKNDLKSFKRKKKTKKMTIEISPWPLNVAV